MWHLRSFIIIVLIIGLAGSAFAAIKEEGSVYNGKDPVLEGIVLGGWGSGKAVATQKVAIEGSHSIEVTSQGFYSGARLDFVNPVPLIKNGLDKTKYLLFTIFFSNSEVVNPAGQNSQFYDVRPYLVPAVKKMRFVFISDTGLTLSLVQNTTPIDTYDNWDRVAAPLGLLKLPEGVKDFNLKRLLIFADSETKFNVGKIKLVKDDSPIKIDQIGGQYVAIYDPVYVQADVDAGVSSVEYLWDYGDRYNTTSSDTTSTQSNRNQGMGGIGSSQIQSKTNLDLPGVNKGKIGYHIYTKGGDYTVTFTVTDVTGVKDPVTMKTKISVSE